MYDSIYHYSKSFVKDYPSFANSPDDRWVKFIRGNPEFLQYSPVWLEIHRYSSQELYTAIIADLSQVMGYDTKERFEAWFYDSGQNRRVDRQEAARSVFYLVTWCIWEMGIMEAFDLYEGRPESNKPRLNGLSPYWELWESRPVEGRKKSGQWLSCHDIGF